MNIQEMIRADLWKVIQLHYDKNDYTEAIRDSIFFVNELVRDKSGFFSKDGTALMESTFLGKNAALKINKCETQTEKDIQEGTGYALKGLCLSVRNPISHQNIVIEKNDAISIILYINYLLNIIDKSKGKNKIDDWVDFLMDENFVNNERYATELIKEIPTRKRYDLLLQIFRCREDFAKNSINEIVKLLIESLSEEDRNDFVNVVNKDLLRCKVDNSLKIFLHIFAESIYSEMELLCKLRIEELVKQSITKGLFGFFNYPGHFSDDYYEPECNEVGELGMYISNDLFEQFDSKNDFLIILQKKLNCDDKLERNYVLEFYSTEIFSRNYLLSLDGKSAILKLLKERNKKVIELIGVVIRFDRQWSTTFRAEYNTAIEDI